jgi:hypothetical protein
MVLAIDLNWSPDEDQHGIPDLNEVQWRMSNRQLQMMSMEEVKTSFLLT